jgi:toxin YoeB
MPKIEKVWSAEAWEDYLYWHRQDMAIWERVNELIKDIERSPY